MAPFYGLGSTASRLLFHFTTKFPEIPCSYLTEFRRMKGWADLGAIQWFCGDHVYTYIKNDTVKLTLAISKRFWGKRNFLQEC